MSFTRRNFLKTAGVAGGGMMMSSGFLRGQGGSPNERLNIAIVGVGAEGKVLLDAMSKIPGLQFRAVCDIWDYRKNYGFARGFGYNRTMNKSAKPTDIKKYEDYKDLIANEKDLDAVIIATPDFWHAPQTNDFLKAGVNVYCEKMMSNTVEGARSMVRTMKETGKLLQIGHQRKSNPRYKYMHDVLIRDRQICGTFTNANAQWNRAVTKDLELPKNQPISQETLTKYGFKDAQQFMNWRWYKGLGGGPISDLGAHQIDIFAWMLGGRPISVMAGGGVDYYDNHEWYDNVMCIYEYNTFQGKKARAFYQVLTTTSAGGGYWEMFMGTNGAIKMSENPALAKIFKESNANWDSLVSEGVLTKTGSANNDNAQAIDARATAALAEYSMNVPNWNPEKPIHAYHLENFFNTVRGKEKLNCDAEHAFEAEAAVYKVNEAVEAKKMLMFEDADFKA